MAFEFSALMVKIGADIRDFSINLKKATGELQGFAESAQAPVRNVAITFGAIGAAITGMTTAAVYSFAQFERGLQGVRNDLSDTEAYLMPKFEKGLKDLSAASGTALASLSKGLEVVVTAIKEPSQAMDVLTEANKLGRVALIDTGMAAEGITRILSAYNMAASEAGSVSDWFFTIQREGRANIGEIVNQIKVLAPVAASSGVNLTELGAVLQLLTRHGIDSGMAMQAVRAVIQSFKQPSKEATEISQKLGFEMSASSLRANGLAWAIRMVDKATEDEQQTLLGNYRAKMATAVATQYLSELEGDLASQTNRAGTTQKAYNQEQETTATQFDKLRASMKSFLIDVITPFIPAANIMMNFFGSVVQGIREFAENNQTLVKIVGGLILAIGGITTIISGLAGTLGMLAFSFTSIIKGVEVFKALQATTTAVHQGLNLFSIFMSSIFVASIMAAAGAIIYFYMEMRRTQEQAALAQKTTAEVSVNATQMRIKALDEMLAQNKNLDDADRINIARMREKLVAFAEETAQIIASGPMNEIEIDQRHRMSMALGEQAQALMTKVEVDKSHTAIQITAIANAQLEKQALQQLTEQYIALNQQLSLGMMTKEQYATKFKGLVDQFAPLVGGLDVVMNKLTEIDKSDPNVEIKIEAFGMEKIEDVKERVKLLNQEIVLSKLEGDEKERMSTLFTMQNEVDAIKTKMDMAKASHEVKLLQITAESEEKKKSILIEAGEDKTKQETLLNQEADRIMKTLAMENIKYNELMKLYQQEISGHKTLTDSKLADIGKQIEGYNKLTQASQVTAQSLGLVNRVGGGLGVAQEGLKATTGGWVTPAGGTVLVGPRVEAPQPAVDYSEIVKKRNTYLEAVLKMNITEAEKAKMMRSYEKQIGYQKGTEFVPSTGWYKLHRGEKVTPAGKAEGERVTIINMFSKDFITEMLDPNTIINIINSDIVRNGITRKVIMGVAR